jgi:2-polyprenyl-6-hydroxyphenyl methylase/3-demethylubiquinone-9 3-methyltransferase
MIADYEAVVGSRFDALQARFRRDVATDDPRLVGIVESLWPLAGCRVLDLGCGKGRFSRALEELGARVIGLDLAAGMLAAAVGLDRVRGSARRLPFGAASFDRVMAVEVFEHLEPRALDQVCAEVRRVLRPGGRFALLDKNVCAFDARRPWLPSVAVKRLDQRRGLWMYSHSEPIRERWFRPGRLKRRLHRWFPEVRVVHLLSRAEEGRFPFQQVPGTRLLVLWAVRAPGGSA